MSKRCWGVAGRGAWGIYRVGEGDGVGDGWQV